MRIVHAHRIYDPQMFGRLPQLLHLQSDATGASVDRRLSLPSWTLFLNWFSHQIIYAMLIIANEVCLFMHTYTSSTEKHKMLCVYAKLLKWRRYLSCLRRKEITWSSTSLQQRLKPWNMVHGTNQTLICRGKGLLWLMSREIPYCILFTWQD